MNSPADKLKVITKIDKFVKDCKEKYPDSHIYKTFEVNLKELLKEQKDKTIAAAFGSAELDSAVSELKAGNKGTLFGKKDYDKVITDLASLNAMYNSSKEAFLADGEFVTSPQAAAKEKETLKTMDSYIHRKEIEFRNNAFEGKANNANSKRRYEAMKKLRETLLNRIELNKALSGEEPEPKKEAVKEPELKPVMPELASKYNNDIMVNSIQDREKDADYILSHDPCFRDTHELQYKMKGIREDLEATSMFGGSSVEFKRMLRAFEDLEANIIPGVPEDARINKMNALILLKNATEDYINKKHFDAGVDIDKELVPSTSIGKKHMRGAQRTLIMVNKAIENMNQVAVNEDGYGLDQSVMNVLFGIDHSANVKEEAINQEIVNDVPLEEEPLIHIDDEPEKEEIVNEEPIKEKPIKEEPVKEEPVKEEPLISVDKKPEKEEVVNEKPDIEKKQEQKAPEEKKEEPYTIQRQLNEAQEKISALGEQMNAENLARPLSQIITCYKITGLQKQNLFKNITKEQFDKIDNFNFIKDPIFNEMLKRNVPKDLASQALKDKGQNLFANYQRTIVTVKEEQKQKAENNHTVVNNKEFDSLKLGGSNK